MGMAKRLFKPAIGRDKDEMGRWVRKEPKEEGLGVATRPLMVKRALTLSWECSR